MQRLRVITASGFNYNNERNFLPERLSATGDVFSATSRHLLGIISRSDLVKPSLALFDEEHHRERFLAPSLLGVRRRLRSWAASPGSDKDSG